MINCNPETVSTRLRHVGPPLLRAVDARGRPARHRDRKARRGDRAVRRPNAARPGAAAPERRRHDPRHLTRFHRPRGGPEALRLAARRPSDSGAGVGHRALARRGARDRPAHRIPAPGPALVRARREARCSSRTTRSGWPRRCAAPCEASPEHPVLLDRFLEDAFELDVDALCDGERVVVAGIMQHIEEAGIHSGDSSCVLPPSQPHVTAKLDVIRDYTRAARKRSRRARPHERPVRDQGRHGLRPRGQPASEPDGAVRLEGDRHPAGPARREDHGRTDARGARPRGTSRRSTAASSRPRSSRSPSFRATTRSWAPRCAVPARSWASPMISVGVREGLVRGWREAARSREPRS